MLNFAFTENTREKREEILHNFKLNGMEFKSVKSIKIIVEGVCKYLDEEKHICTIYDKRHQRCKDFLCKKFK